MTPLGTLVGRRGRRDESGSAVVEFVWVGLVLLVPVVWILLSVFEVQQGAFATTAAARSAGRAFVLAPDEATARQRAERVARQVLDEQGKESMPLVLEVRCSAGAGACLSPSSTVTVVVRSGVELPFLPEVLSGATSDFALEATHTVPFGQYRERR
ncbi:hypothetical protein [Nocardioides yefusunii]|uniref:Pilus assembly protein n=1 Tax=Nocardioides yefusunii TaxID=2500546 RepID=A0ABW1QSY0_9ACTN|nr:hypothetical protein [Nocardioides yefusunii]